MRLFEILSEDVEFYEEDEKRPTIKDRVDNLKKDICIVILGLGILVGVTSINNGFTLTTETQQLQEVEENFEDGIGKSDIINTERIQDISEGYDTSEITL